MNLILVFGYLGSGKTTFLTNYLKKLNSPALIVNDFGSENFDEELLKREKAEVYGIENGSIFCSCKLGAFVSTVSVLAMSSSHENIIVECSGLANPQSLLNVLELIEEKSPNLHYSGGITVVDGKKFEKMAGGLSLLKSQVEKGDVIFISKTENLEETSFNRLVTLLKSLNKHAQILTFSKTQVPDFHLEKVDKPSSKEVFDLGLQKLTLTISEKVTEENLKDFCKELSVFSHRIKGSCLFGTHKHFDFDEGQLSFKDVSSSKNKMVVLTAQGQNLKKSVEELLKRPKFSDFQLGI